MAKFLTIPNLTRVILAAALLILTNPIHSSYARPNSAIQSGTIIAVTTDNDELNTDGDCSLREALRAANLNISVDKCPAGTGADTIALSPAIYSLSLTGSGEDQGLTGDLDIFDDVSIAGTSLSSTIIDGNEIDRIFHVVSDVDVLFTNLTIRNGHAPAGGFYGGGGILNGSEDISGATIRILNCLFSENLSESTGGGLDNSGTAFLQDVTFRENKAYYGGGIFNIGSLSIEGATFTQNIAKYTGGGLDNNSESGNTLINVTFSANTTTALDNGGLFNDGKILMLNLTFAGNGPMNLVNKGEIRLKNTIFAYSTGGVNCYEEGNFVTLGHNLADDTSCALGSSDLVDTDPLLDALSENLGPTMTHALLDGSPAIDAGDNYDCPLQDQRGAYRPADGDGNGTQVCDIGSYEYAGVFPFYTFLPAIFR